MRKTIAMLIGAAMLPMAIPASAQAPNYPDKPIRIVVPFPVGGIADVFGREIGRKLTEAWGQPVVIDNRAEPAETSARTSSPRRRRTATRW
jgi:tripartite-type tricarboxylate transporter receptor subunit TctC